MPTEPFTVDIYTFFGFKKFIFHVGYVMTGV